MTIKLFVGFNRREGQRGALSRAVDLRALALLMSSTVRFCSLLVEMGLDLLVSTRWENVHAQLMSLFVCLVPILR